MTNWERAILAVWMTIVWILLIAILDALSALGKDLVPEGALMAFVVFTALTAAMLVTGRRRN